eukprot:TCONS_00050363-protein
MTFNEKWRLFFYACVLIHITSLIARLSVDGYVKDHPNRINQTDYQSRFGIQEFSPTVRSWVIFATIFELVLVLAMKYFCTSGSGNMFLLFAYVLDLILNIGLPILMLHQSGFTKNVKPYGVDYVLVYAFFIMVLVDFLSGFLTFRTISSTVRDEDVQTGLLNADRKVNTYDNPSYLKDFEKQSSHDGSYRIDTF